MALAAVTLDAAGTLFEPAEPVGVTYARAAARHGIIVTPDEVARGFAAALAGAPPLAFPGAGPADLPARERAWWYAVVRAALGVRAPADALEGCFDELFAHYARPDAWRVFADVVPALTALRGLRLAVVSNFDGRLPALLAGLGLAPFLDAVVYSSSVAAAKPEPAIFHAALRKLDVPAAEALHVGDGVIADTQGARAAGMRAVLLDRSRRRPPVPPDVRVIDSLAELARSPVWFSRVGQP